MFPLCFVVVIVTLPICMFLYKGQRCFADKNQQNFFCSMNFCTTSSGGAGKASSLRHQLLTLSLTKDFSGWSVLFPPLAYSPLFICCITLWQLLCPVISTGDFSVAWQAQKAAACWNKQHFAILFNTHIHDLQVPPLGPGTILAVEQTSLEKEASAVVCLMFAASYLAGVCCVLCYLCGSYQHEAGPGE